MASWFSLQICSYGTYLDDGMIWIWIQNCLFCHFSYPLEQNFPSLQKKLCLLVDLNIIKDFFQMRSNYYYVLKKNSFFTFTHLLTSVLADDTNFNITLPIIPFGIRYTASPQFSSPDPSFGSPIKDSG